MSSTKGLKDRGVDRCACVTVFKKDLKRIARANLILFIGHGGGGIHCDSGFDHLVPTRNEGVDGKSSDYPGKYPFFKLLLTT